MQFPQTLTDRMGEEIKWYEPAIKEKQGGFGKNRVSGVYFSPTKRPGSQL